MYKIRLGKVHSASVVNGAIMMWICKWFDIDDESCAEWWLNSFECVTVLVSAIVKWEVGRISSIAITFFILEFNICERKHIRMSCNPSWKIPFPIRFSMLFYASNMTRRFWISKVYYHIGWWIQPAACKFFNFSKEMNKFAFGMNEGIWWENSKTAWK